MMRYCGRREPRWIRSIKHCALGFSAYSAHALGREQRILTIHANADHDEQRD
jgi:hypothetical protein